MSTLASPRSPSNSSTRGPAAPAHVPGVIARQVLPTPPLPEATATMRPPVSRDAPCGRSWRSCAGPDGPEAEQPWPSRRGQRRQPVGAPGRCPASASASPAAAAARTPPSRRASIQPGRHQQPGAGLARRRRDRRLRAGSSPAGGTRAMSASAAAARGPRRVRLCAASKGSEPGASISTGGAGLAASQRLRQRGRDGCATEEVQAEQPGEGGQLLGRAGAAGHPR